MTPVSSPSAPTPPYIPRGSKHYTYALLIVAGVPYEDACAHETVDVSTRTAERWRSDLRKVAEEYFKRPVDYHYAARFATDEELRRLCANLSEPADSPNAKSPAHN